MIFRHKNLGPQNEPPIIYSDELWHHCLRHGEVCRILKEAVLAVGNPLATDDFEVLKYTHRHDGFSVMTVAIKNGDGARLHTLEILRESIVNWICDNYHLERKRWI